MTMFKHSHITDWVRLALLTVSLGFSAAGTAAYAQTDEATGLPARAIRSVDYRTVGKGKVVFEIQYYYDRISKKQLAAAAPTICTRLDIKFDRVFFPPDNNDQGDLFYARARTVEVRCK